jgi:hypothetical protein
MFLPHAADHHQSEVVAQLNQGVNDPWSEQIVELLLVIPGPDHAIQIHH